jgi:hypothetical protein
MKSTKSIFWSFLLLLVLASVYRIFPNRPFGFAPQWAIALFAGMMIRDRKWALAVPVLSLFLSDVLYQLLFLGGASRIPGFYDGQWQNYALFALLALLASLIRKVRIWNLLFAGLFLPTIYFILSNLILWAGWSGTRGLGRPKTWDGLVQCYADAVPFYRMSVLATLFFSALIFGSWYLLSRRNPKAIPVEGI